MAIKYIVVFKAVNLKSINFIALKLVLLKQLYLWCSHNITLHWRQYFQ